MDGPLLATKLHPPGRRAGAVARSRLTERLRDPARLVVVVAPAGFGKTSLLTEWLAEEAGARTAWLSVDERDNDATQFWRYALTALDRAHPGVASEALERLAAAPAAVEPVIATLVNALESAGAEITLVLDDYHLIEAPEVHEAVIFLVEHLPSTARIVIASRADPPLPLARMRARGELRELRAEQLRFTSSETAAYLNDSMGLDLDIADAEALGERTEGWIAALQLAALSLEGNADPSAFIADFAGDDRYIVDYLVEEVLRRQPDAVRSFLVQTSVLPRLSGELCDAVTGGTGSAQTLEQLERANLFLVPLDAHRTWYRYHHLFAEMLRARLLDEARESIPQLHRRASDWFAAHDEIPDAFDQAIEAAAFEQAVMLLKGAMPEMQQRRQEVTLASWFARLPAELVRADPELGVGFAGVLLSSGRTEGVERLLADAEAVPGSSPENIRAVRQGVALFRAAHALTSGELHTAEQQTEIAMELAQSGTHLDRGSASGLRGLVLWTRGDLENARLAWEASRDALTQAGHLADVTGVTIAIGDILTAQGRLHDAEQSYRRALALASASTPPLRGAADMHTGLAEVLRERGDLEGARAQLRAVEELGEHAGLPQNRHRRRMAAARLMQAEGEAAAAVALLDEAEALYTPDFFPEVQPIAALRSRMLLASGRIAEARESLRARHVAPDDELDYLREYDHITLARVLAAEASGAEGLAGVLHLIERLLAAAESGGRDRAVIELLVLRALAVQRSGQATEALASLVRAVALAEPEGYVRVFADEGEPMARLLAALVKRSGATRYLRRLQAAAGAAASEPPASGGLVDPLSERELEVLRLLATELSGPEIARHLVVSLNTVRTHTKNIYAKLGATSRREAVRRAAELGLLESPR
ncbi:MAG: LuxR C-terminal-related transcriptional regulator [Protaetiibacter sp.]